MIQVNYRAIQNDDSWPACVTRVADISASNSLACFYREKNSHRGISKCSHLKKLIAKQVNQNFLKEISALKGLEYLELEIVTAEDLSVLKGLPNLKTLKIDSPRKTTNPNSLR